MSESLKAPAGLHRHDGDEWVECGDHQHWGRYGAAGLLLVRRGADGAPGHLVLQHRALWSHMGGTWGIPGGALAPGESPGDGALREAAEEAAVDPAAVEVVGTHVLEHPVWRYTTVVAELRPGARVDPRAADAESLAVRWVALSELGGLSLLPPFEAALPALLDLLPPGVRAG
ncbi:NUDIX domain-containing protein [Myceligenerans xiligouense]|uniref:ADP-ribose pyrophosphatase YjhB (NUDIX family) n=1 Tax=Myceligenerans xiligouense TaxID=253184 RepID=A0A3N4YSI9_9MICO|nr:NUDIX domain-containing protein [Myceligenerans xiligouense]RPF22466.1 ADP-ribose pyrophosphatase YjhB (NUDIX family) [Myceligenerans xiligouense]